MSERTVFLSPAAVERREDLRIVDVRDEWEYDGIGHLPGAVSIPFASFRSEDNDEGMLPGTPQWGRLLSDAGIDTDDDVLAYDDTHGVFAARFLVTAELYGHDPDRLFLLDGDYSAWSREHAVSREAPNPEPTTYEPSEPANSPLIDFDAVARALAAAGYDSGVSVGDSEVGSEVREADSDPSEGEDTQPVIVDTREAWEYEEGHLPGAVQLDWRELVDTDGTRGVKSADERLAICRERGITPDRRVILYCNTARRISHTYLVLRDLGFDDLAFYEGSLTEWERRGGRTVTGPDPT